MSTPDSKSPEAVHVEPIQAYLAALKDGSVPKIYGNQYSAVIGAHDINIMFGVNGIASGVVTMTYPMAKALAKGLSDAIAGYEKTVKFSVPDAATLEAALKDKSA